MPIRSRPGFAPSVNLPVIPIVAVAAAGAVIPSLPQGIRTMLPPRIFDRNRLTELRIASETLNVGLRTPLRSVVLFDRIRGTLRAAGITDLSALGQVRLSGSQTWKGGQFLRGDRPTIVIRDRLPIAGVLERPLRNPFAGGTRRVRTLRALQQPSPLTSIDEFWVAADEIVLAAGLDAVIRVPGAAMLIANKITVEPGARISWEPNWGDLGINVENYDNPGNGAHGATGSPGTGNTWSADGPPASKQGGKGGSGGQGKHGIDGPDAPSLVLLAASMNRLPILDLTGYRGGRGGHGGNGGRGGPGAKGEPAKCYSTGIRDRGRGWGGRGGTGGDAGAGGVGGKGGDGGSVEVFCPQDVKDAITALIDMRLAPGPGGDGGPAGNPGAGGSGGSQGSDSCIGWGPDGRGGPDGSAGRADTTPPADLRGPDGEFHGLLQLSVVSRDVIAAKFNMPHISTLVPPNAAPGATVTIYGGNIPVNTRVKAGTAIVPLNRTDTASGSFVVPANTESGLVTIELVDAAGAVISNQAALAVMPRLDSLAGAGRWGAIIQLKGAGFRSGSRVRVGTKLLDAVRRDAATLDVALPMPGGAFEQVAEDLDVCVVDPEGRESAKLPLRMEHWLHLGMDPVLDGFAFDNSATELGNVPDSVIDLDLFEETFGEDDMDTLAPDDLAAIGGAVIDPAATGAGWLFFLAYKEFLKSRPGVCCAWSAFALDHYLSGGASLRDQFDSMSEVGRELFALQGRVLSLENIEAGLAQAALGHGSNARFLTELEDVLRDIVAGRGDETAKRYPLLTFISRPTSDVAAYWGRLSEQHIILPYAVRFPGPGENFIARVYCVSNWPQRHARVDFTDSGGETHFRAREFAGASGEDPYDASATYGDLSAYRTSQDWIVGSTSMAHAMYDDVDIPTNILKILSPVTVQIDAGSNRRIGFAKGDLWAHLDHIAPVPWAKGLFLLRGVDSVTVQVRGEAAGAYGIGMMDYASGRGAFVLDVKTKRGQRDRVELATGAPQARITPGADVGPIRIATVQRGLTGTRAAVLRGERGRKQRTLGLMSPGGGGLRAEGTGAAARLRLGLHAASGIRLARDERVPRSGSARRAGSRGAANPWASLEARAAARESASARGAQAPAAQRNARKRRNTSAGRKKHA